MKVNKIKAAILIEQKKPLEIAEIDIPEELEYGQVLVKVHYSCICGSQLNEIDGAKGPDKHLPHLLGHEGSATVLATGRGVTHVQKGDLVVMHWREGAGIKAETPKYKWGNKTVNAGWVTTFQNYSVVSENRVTKIPNNFDKKIAPLFGCAVTTAAGVVNNDAQIHLGQSVVVFGIGGVGINIIQMAQLVSAYPIVGIDLIDKKLAMAKNFGASHVLLSAKTTNIEEDVKKIVGESGADVVIDTTGNPRVIELAYNLTHPDGKTILVGVPKKGNNVSIYTLPLHFKKTLHGSHGGSAQPDIDIPRLIKLYQAGILKLKGIITHEYPLSQINQAITKVRSGTSGRVLIEMK